MRIAAIPPSVVVLLASAVAGAQTAATPAPSSPPAQPAASAPAQPPAPAPSAAAGLKPETAATADLQFEVATIKPSDPAECCGRTYGEDGRRFQTRNTYLRWLLMWAYGLQSDQIVGAPAWIDVDRYNLSGELEGTETPTDHQWRAAVQKLLVDRFQMQVRWEKREMKAYALVVAKGGPKFEKGDDDPHHPPRTGFGGAVGQTMYGSGQNVTITEFFAQVQRLTLDRPVVDQTGLTGRYNMQLEFTREDPAALGMSQIPDNAPPNLFSAVQEQLGLKLEATKAPVDVLVIDHVEKPSPD
jgi:uncharacterized protein (TIGR03435 family)